MEIIMSNGFQAPPILGYQDVSGDKQAMVNELKEMEERILRQLDYLAQLHGVDGSPGSVRPPFADTRWLAVGRTHIQQAFMAINRAVFQPQRIKLPEDTP
jgi:hypothetical protein